MRDQRTLLGGTAYGIPSLRGAPVHRDLIGSETGTSPSDITDRAAKALKLLIVITPGRLDGYDTLIEQLAQDLQDLTVNNFRGSVVGFFAMPTNGHILMGKFPCQVSGQHRSIPEHRAVGRAFVVVCAPLVCNRRNLHPRAYHGGSVADESS